MAVARPSSPERVTFYTSLNLKRRHVDRANEMAAHLQMNRNQMFRLLLDNLTNEDLDGLWARSTAGQ